jgi:hypothetical protein
MMRGMFSYGSTLCAILLVLAACATKPKDVWSTYDYSDPLTSDSGIYSDEAVERNPERQVYDNDDTYRLPGNFGICNEGMITTGC